MRRIIFLALVLLFPSLDGAAGPTEKSDRLVIYFIGSRSCAECLRIKDEILKPLAAEYPGIIDLRLHNIEDPESFQLMLRLEEKFGVTESSPQELFLPGDILVGESAPRRRREHLAPEYPWALQR